MKKVNRQPIIKNALLYFIGLIISIYFNHKLLGGLIRVDIGLIIFTLLALYVEQRQEGKNAGTHALNKDSSIKKIPLIYKVLWLLAVLLIYAAVGGLESF